MATDTEIYRTANLLIEEFGDMAPASAFIKADQMEDQGEERAHAIWLRVAKAAEDILSEERPGHLLLN